MVTASGFCVSGNAIRAAVLNPCIADPGNFRAQQKMLQKYPHQF
jgi:hypothetical protein